MFCPSCKHENPEDATFCGECGATLVETLTCNPCGASNPPAQKFGETLNWFTEGFDAPDLKDAKALS
jgi:predicted amidophosphoribosyltransferase